MKKNIVFIGLGILIIDQIVKMIISNTMALNSSIIVIKDFFYIRYIHNNGAAWGILDNNIFFLITIGILVLSYLIYMIKKEKVTLLTSISYGLLLGGIVGNLLDRIIHSYVIDYFNFYIFNYDFPVFNIADASIVIGVGLFIINMIRSEKNAQNNS